MKIWRQDKDKEINKDKDQRQKKKNKSYNMENCHTNLRIVIDLYLLLTHNAKLDKFIN